MKTRFDFRRMQYGFLPLSERAVAYLQDNCGFSWSLAIEPVRLTNTQVASLAAAGFVFC